MSCRKTAEKESLLRFVRRGESGRVVIDIAGNLEGRGVYCHLHAACLGNRKLGNLVRGSLSRSKAGEKRNEKRGGRRKLEKVTRGDTASNQGKVGEVEECSSNEQHQQENCSALRGKTQELSFFVEENLLSVFELVTKKLQPPEGLGGVLTKKQKRLANVHQALLAVMKAHRKESPKATNASTGTKKKTIRL